MKQVQMLCPYSLWVSHPSVKGLNYLLSINHMEGPLLSAEHAAANGFSEVNLIKGYESQEN